MVYSNINHSSLQQIYFVKLFLLSDTHCLALFISCGSISAKSTNLSFPIIIANLLWKRRINANNTERALSERRNMAGWWVMMTFKRPWHNIATFSKSTRRNHHSMKVPYMKSCACNIAYNMLRIVIYLVYDMYSWMCGLNGTESAWLSMLNLAQNDCSITSAVLMHYYLRGSCWPRECWYTQTLW